ncbi:MAG TPA: nucleotidyltransferase domain-containing protein [Phnomibacter sp.]|nr:nucleotidyltransferase domain-containing protein [Phnomibacter sp.]
MLNKKTIIETIKENRAQLKTFGVKHLGLFGSFARNDAHDESDIDLIIIFEKGKKNFDNLLGAHSYLESLFGKKTELITEDAVSDSFKNFISKEIEYVGI